MKPDMVSVIPNAVDGHVFTPDTSRRTPGKSELCFLPFKFWFISTSFLSGNSIMWTIGDQDTALQWIEIKSNISEAREKGEVDLTPCVTIKQSTQNDQCNLLVTCLNAYVFSLKARTLMQGSCYEVIILKPGGKCWSSWEISSVTLSSKSQPGRWFFLRLRCKKRTRILDPLVFSHSIVRFKHCISSLWWWLWVCRNKKQQNMILYIMSVSNSHCCSCESPGLQKRHGFVGRNTTNYVCKLCRYTIHYWWVLL